MGPRRKLQRHIMKSRTNGPRPTADPRSTNLRAPKATRKPRPLESLPKGRGLHRRPRKQTTESRLIHRQTTGNLEKVRRKRNTLPLGHLLKTSLYQIPNLMTELSMKPLAEMRQNRLLGTPHSRRRQRPRTSQ